MLAQEIRYRSQLPSVLSIFTELGDKSFSLVVNEIYESGSLSIRRVRCPEKSEVAARINQVIENQGLHLNFTKIDLILVCKHTGVVLEKAPVKGGGVLSHIYYFCPASADPLSGLQFEAVFGRDAVYKAEANRENRLLNLAERYFEQ